MRYGWNAEKHFLITVLVYIKKLFYMQSFEEYTTTTAATTTTTETYSKNNNDINNNNNSIKDKLNFIENDEAYQMQV